MKTFCVISGKDDDLSKSKLVKFFNDLMNYNFKDEKNDFNNETENEKGNEMDDSENESLSFYKSISKRNFFTINEISSIAKTSSHFSKFSSISKEYNVLCSSFYNFSVRKRISVINLSNLFNGCSSLELIKDINYWNIKDSINMSSMFKECKSLVSLPYISLWKTNNVLDMSYLFCGCSLLTSLPDISKLNIQKVYIL